MLWCRGFVAFRYAVLAFVDLVNVWFGDLEILRLCDLTLLWFVDFDIWRRSEFVTLGLHMFIFLRLCIFAIREVVIYRNSISAISRVCFFQNLFFCECSNRHFGNIAIWWLLRFCGLKMQTWCIWLCESVLHDKTDRYRKVESAYQCWQSGVDSQTSFTEHPAFRTLATLIGRLHFTILLKWSRWFRQIFFPTAVGFGWLHPPKKESTKKTGGLSCRALQHPSFKEQVEWRQKPTTWTASVRSWTLCERHQTNRLSMAAYSDSMSFVICPQTRTWAHFSCWLGNIDRPIPLYDRRTISHFRNKLSAQGRAIFALSRK